VYDIISRAEKSLVEMEQKTGVVHRWRETRSELERAGAIARELLKHLDDRSKPHDLTSELILTLQRMSG
jgi:predicted DNA-binding protein YlxM (UPF0122 family)